jgi:RNA recognition motif-containing protein
MTTKSLYVGNLAFNATKEEVSNLFTQYGQVESVRIIMDKQTGKARGFCFVEMAEANCEKVINELNGALFKGRPLRVTVAVNKPKGGQ